MKYFLLLLLLVNLTPWQSQAEESLAQSSLQEGVFVAHIDLWDYESTSVDLEDLDGDDGLLAEIASVCGLPHYQVVTYINVLSYRRFNSTSGIRAPPAIS